MVTIESQQTAEKSGVKDFLNSGLAKALHLWKMGHGMVDGSSMSLNTVIDLAERTGLGFTLVIKRTRIKPLGGGEAFGWVDKKVIRIRRGLRKDYIFIPSRAEKNKKHGLALKPYAEKGHLEVRSSKGTEAYIRPDHIISINLT